MIRRTKIICTIGPASNSLENVIALMEAGMNVARLNFSHGTHDEHLKTLNTLKKARTQLGRPLAIMLDTRGPEVRIGKVKDGEIRLRKGQNWELVAEEVMGDLEKVTITPPSVLNDLKVGTTVLFDDGFISTKVVEVREKSVVVEIENGGHLGSGKGVNVPDVSLDLPSVTDKDIADIQFGCREDVDMIAASFVRTAENIITIKNLLQKEGRSDIKIIAKIENREGIDNFDSIIQVANGVMIARGDLGVEVPISQVPKLQKMMILKSNLAGIPSITATQMLENMILHPRPTRAEVSDVANAIYDSTSAVMLSGETAVGRYPVKTVEMMDGIVKEAEDDFDYQTFFQSHSRLIYNDVPSAVTLATVKTAYSSNASAIFAFTSGGGTARLLARLRPKMPIIAMTPDRKTYNQMSCNWGVYPYLGEACRSFEEAFSRLSEFAVEQGLVSYGDLVVVTAGTPFGVAGTTNMMIVESIGDVLVRGYVGKGVRIHGKVVMVLSPELTKPYEVRDQICVIPKCDESYLPLLREASGIILQNHIEDQASEKYALKIGKEIQKPVIVRADAAAQTMKPGQLITMDPEKALVYKGVVL